MTILNFTVEFAKSKILSDEKQRTMRPVRDNQNSVWNRLYEKWTKFQQTPTLEGTIGVALERWKRQSKLFPLQIWWQQRSRKLVCDICGYTRSKDITMCPSCQLFTHQSPEAHKLCDAVLTNMTKRTLGSLTEEEWRLDGFLDREHGFQWFADTYDLPLWADHHVDSERYHDELVNMMVYIIEFRRVSP